MRGSRKPPVPLAEGRIALSVTSTERMREPLAPNQRREPMKRGATVRSKAWRSRPRIRVSTPPVSTRVNSSGASGLGPIVPAFAVESENQ